MRLGVTGGTGFVGARAVALAAARGWEVTILTRRPEALPSPPAGGVRRFVVGEPAPVDDLDAVLHLAGEPVFGLWTAAKRRRIRESRVLGTRSVVEGIRRAARPPRVLVSGSATGFYGDTGDREATEASPPGRGFLAGVVRDWEAEAVQAPTRVVLLRTGFVLGRGGALRLVLPVFRAGLGGPLGSGRQWMSCIHVDDIAGMALWAAETAAVHGPLNGVMPSPCTNRDFTRAVARAVHRPAVLPAPAVALRLALGELSSLLLDSSRVLPAAAAAGGFVWRFPGLQEALDDVARSA
jgi:uncharacterized protein (TIGR01777 family)